MGHEALDYFLPSIDGRRCSVFLKKMGGESRLAIHRDFKKESPGALTEATAGSLSHDPQAGHMPCWWPSLVLFLLLSLVKAIHASDSEMPGSIPINTLKMWVLLEIGRLVREEKEILIQKKKLMEWVPKTKGSGGNPVGL